MIWLDQSPGLGRLPVVERAASETAWAQKYVLQHLVISIKLMPFLLRFGILPRPSA